MKYAYSLTLFVFLNLTASAQLVNSWQIFPYGNAQGLDIISVDDTYIVSVIHGVNQVVNGELLFFRDTDLIKLDADLVIIDSVRIRSAPNHNSYIQNMKWIGDSLYVQVFQIEVSQGSQQVFHSLQTFDKDLNRGAVYPVLQDTLLTLMSSMFYKDTTLLIVGSVGSMTKLAQYDLLGNVISDTLFSISSPAPFFRSVWDVPSTDQVLFCATNGLMYFDMQNMIIDSAVSISPAISGIYSFDNLHLGVQLDPTSLTRYVSLDDFGVVGQSFLLDSTIVPRGIQYQARRALINAIDYDSVSGNLYFGNIHNYSLSGGGVSSLRDTNVAELFIHHYDPISQSIVWKREIELYRVVGSVGFPAISSIRATPDGGCIVLFAHAAESASFGTIGSMAYVLLLDANGNIFRYESFGNDESQFKIFPNPSASFITIENLETSLSFSVRDMQGREVFNQQKMDTRHVLDVSSWPKGSYIILMNAQDGKQMFKQILVN